MSSTKIKKNDSTSPWTCLHHMVILRSENKITDFLMILAWASPFNFFTSPSSSSDRSCIGLPRKVDLKEITFACYAQYKPMWWFLSAIKFNLYSDSFEITSPVAIPGNNDVSWRLVICVLKLKVEQFITIVRMCVCMDSIVCLAVNGTF